MFAYLSKKIAIPGELKLRALAWNSANGWIACGGASGLLKVLKLESQARELAATQSGTAPHVGGKPASNLSMNQTLEGHQGDVIRVAWNSRYRKLTSADSRGKITVWMLYKGVWYEEMINNRNKSTVADLRWTPDGQRICIAYEDGMALVGSVDGNRIWGKELCKDQVRSMQWSPDGRSVLFATSKGELQKYDQSGNYLGKSAQALSLSLSLSIIAELNISHYFKSRSHRLSLRSSGTTEAKAMSSRDALLSLLRWRAAVCC